MFWISPLKGSDPASLALMADLNVWSPDYQSVAPHGPIVHNNDASNPGALGSTPAALGGSEATSPLSTAP
jgi:hypothetical protein